jgi:hypothetical protein
LEQIDNDPSVIPDHILLKVNEKVDRALRKDPLADQVYYNTTEGKLEYFDLRECQQLMTTKSMWERFSGVFSHKETMIKRYDQLAELRNTLRHARSLNDVVRMEGEAAIRWFKDILG